MKQTLLIIFIIITLFLGYMLPVEPIKNSIDFVILGLTSTRNEIKKDYLEKCAVQIKGTINHEKCNEN